jgi:RNA polymerase sigma factor (sigma-70 family)
MGKRAEIADLAKQSERGNRVATEELYKSFAPKLKSILKKNCDDNPVLLGRVDPSDLTQSVFIWWFRHFKDSADMSHGTAEAILVTVGRKRIQHYVRMFRGATRDRRLEASGEAALDGIEYEQESPSTRLTNEELSQILQRAINKLTERERSWIKEWRHGEKQTFKEMAVKMHMSDEALKKMHYRTIEKLFVILAGDVSGG